MYIEGRRKNETPKIMKELALYILLMSEYSLVRDKYLAFFRITERTLYRFLHDLEVLLDYPIRRVSGAQKEFRLINTDEEADPGDYDPDMLQPHFKKALGNEKVSENGIPAANENSAANAAHLARLYRLMLLYYMQDDLCWDIRLDLKEGIAEDEIEWIPIASAMEIYREDPAIGPLSRRTVERDLKLVHDTLRLISQYDDRFMLP